MDDEGDGLAERDDLRRELLEDWVLGVFGGQLLPQGKVETLAGLLQLVRVELGPQGGRKLLYGVLDVAVEVVQGLQHFALLLNTDEFWEIGDIQVEEFLGKHKFLFLLVELSCLFLIVLKQLESIIQRSIS